MNLKKFFFNGLWLVMTPIYAFAADLTLWDGENTADLELTSVGNASIIDGSPCKAGHCLELVPTQWHTPFIHFKAENSTAHPLYRTSLKNYDVIQFWARSDSSDGNIFISILGWPQESKTLDITPYIVGGGGLSTTEYKEVRIPTDDLKKLPPEVAFEDRAELISLEYIKFGTQVANTQDYKIWVDDIRALRTKDPEAEFLGLHTASNDLIVVELLTGDDLEDIPVQDTNCWSVNGQEPLEVGLASMPYDEGPLGVVELEIKHFIYLRLATSLIDGRDYQVSTPYNNTHTLTYRDTETFCESIKVNQAGYASGTTERNAIFGIYAGDLGSETLDSGSVNFQVIDEQSNTVLLNGVSSYWGDDTGPVESEASGEHVYHLDLSTLPIGGPYFISIPGYGRSFSFGVGSDYMRNRAYVATRGLYHQRCGIALDNKYTDHPRGICHSYVALTDAALPDMSVTTFITQLTGKTIADIDFQEMKVEVDGQSVDVIEIDGGYHDAADFDRRPWHISIPASMLTYFDLFPDHFSDGQFNIPESGNGIPDFLDEALWGVRFYENLQTENGGIRAGTETDRHPPVSEGAASDVSIYGTFEVKDGMTANAAGLFAHASRLVRPYDITRAAALLTRSRKAWSYFHANYPGTLTPVDGETSEEKDLRNRIIPQILYAAGALYLATGEQEFHDKFIEYSYEIYSRNVHNYRFFPTTISEILRSAYFMPYLVQTERAVNTRTKKILVSKVISEARVILDKLSTQAYPVGVSYPYFNWGASTGQGQFTDILVMAYRLTEQIPVADRVTYFDEIKDYLGTSSTVFEEPQTYYNAISTLSDYIFGLNPLGMSYMTGIGSNQVNSILHSDNYQKIYYGRPNVPGTLVFGPQAGLSNLAYQVGVYERIHPKVTDMPPQRRWSDGWSWVSANEFSTWETIVNAACLQGFLYNDSVTRNKDWISISPALYMLLLL